MEIFIFGMLFLAVAIGFALADKVDVWWHNREHRREHERNRTYDRKRM